MISRQCYKPTRILLQSFSSHGSHRRPVPSVFPVLTYFVSITLTLTVFINYCKYALYALYHTTNDTTATRRSRISDNVLCGIVRHRVSLPSSPWPVHRVSLPSSPWPVRHETLNLRVVGRRNICPCLPNFITCQLPLKLSVHLQATKHLPFPGFGTAHHGYNS